MEQRRRITIGRDRNGVAVVPSSSDKRDCLDGMCLVRFESQQNAIAINRKRNKCNQRGKYNSHERTVIESKG